MSTTVSTYRLDRGVAMTTVGVFVIVAAVAVFVAFVLAPLDSPVRTIGYAAIVVAVLAVLGALRFAFRPPVLLRLDDDGYHSRTGVPGRVFSGRWLDVEDVTADDEVLQLTTAAGTEQLFPLRFVGGQRMRLLRDVHDRLNAANGYRRFGA